MDEDIVVDPWPVQSNACLCSYWNKKDHYSPFIILKKAKSKKGKQSSSKIEKAVGKFSGLSSTHKRVMKKKVEDAIIDILKKVKPNTDGYDAFYDYFETLALNKELSVYKFPGGKSAIYKKKVI